MKRAGAMKAAMKAMKAKKVSVIARGKGARARVLSGSKQKTGSGMTKDKLMRNKAGKVVSKKASAAARKKWEKNGLKAWADAVKEGAQGVGPHRIRGHRWQVR